MNEAYISLLGDIGIHVEQKTVVEPAAQEPVEFSHECRGEWFPEESNSYIVCSLCGLVLSTLPSIDMDNSQRHRRMYRHENPRWLGLDEDSYMPRRRYYNPITHFRQHLRCYMSTRITDIPSDIMSHMQLKIDITRRDCYHKVKLELKKMNRQEYYKDIFSIIYALGAPRPAITPEQMDAMCNYFKRWYHHFNTQSRFGGHNTPSMHMLLNIIMKEFGHEPYYDMPMLKSEKLRSRVYTIYEDVKKLCF